MTAENSAARYRMKFSWERDPTRPGGFVLHDPTLGSFHAYPLESCPYKILQEYGPEPWNLGESRGWRLEFQPDRQPLLPPEEMRQPYGGPEFYGFLPLANQGLARRHVEALVEAAYRQQPTWIHRVWGKHHEKAICGRRKEEFWRHRHQAATPLKDPAKNPAVLRPWEAPCPQCYPSLPAANPPQSGEKRKESAKGGTPPRNL